MRELHFPATCRWRHPTLSGCFPSVRSLFLDARNDIIIILLHIYYFVILLITIFSSFSSFSDFFALLITTIIVSIYYYYYDVTMSMWSTHINRVFFLLFYFFCACLFIFRFDDDCVIRPSPPPHLCFCDCVRRSSWPIIGVHVPPPSATSFGRPHLEVINGYNPTTRNIYRLQLLPSPLFILGFCLICCLQCIVSLLYC